MWYFETINYRLHGAAKFILRKFTSKFDYENVRILPRIPNFGFDARSVPIILDHSNFYPSVFTPIHILFKVPQNFLRKKRFFDTPYCVYRSKICADKQYLVPVLTISITQHSAQKGKFANLN